MKVVFFDFETRSHIDLRKVGLARYVAHPSTEGYCCSIVVGDKNYLWVKDGVPKPEGFNYITKEQAIKLLDGADKLAAHNIQFDMQFLDKEFGIKRPLKDFFDTASMAQVVTGVSRSLHDAGESLGIELKKLTTSRTAMMQLCRPRRVSKKFPEEGYWNLPDKARLDKEHPHYVTEAAFNKLEQEVLDKYETLYTYAIRDTEACRLVFKRCWEHFKKYFPKDILLRERLIERLTWEINNEGVKINTELAAKALEVVEARMETLTDDLLELTKKEAAETYKELVVQGKALKEKIKKGEPCKEGFMDNETLLKNVKERLAGIKALKPVERFTQRQRVLDYLNYVNDLNIPNLQAYTVHQYSEANPDNKLLGLLSEAKSTGWKKLTTMLEQSIEGHVKNSMVYYGANTGRYSSRGLQLQNMARPPDFDYDGLIAGKVEIPKDSVVKVASGLPRYCIQPKKGKKFLALDFKTIEYRVLLWLAGDKKHLDMAKKYDETESEEFDPYIELATRIYGYRVAKGSKERQLGKNAVLGLGFCGGAQSLILSGQKNKQTIPAELALRAVAVYRNEYKKVVALWDKVYKDVMSKTKDKKGYIVIDLPNGRPITLWNVRWEAGEWTCLKKTGQTPISKSILVENIVQAIARDIMCDAMLRFNKMEDVNIAFTVHDELVLEVPKDWDDERCAEVANMATKADKCYDGIPLAIEFWTGDYYRK